MPRRGRLQRLGADLPELFASGLLEELPASAPAPARVEVPCRLAACAFSRVGAEVYCRPTCPVVAPDDPDREERLMVLAALEGGRLRVEQIHGRLPAIMHPQRLSWHLAALVADGAVVHVPGRRYALSGA